MKTIKENISIETFKEIYTFFYNENVGVFFKNTFNDDFINEKYKKYIEHMERIDKVKWWSELNEGTKRVLMERYWSKFRPYIQQPHFVSININNISGREIEIIHNEEHNRN
jgi:hypothetical protein